MALPNRPLTPSEVAAIRDSIGADIRMLYDRSDIFRLINEPRHSFVHYQARRGGATFIPPETFYWPTDASPSDSVWMVPGTERR